MARRTESDEYLDVSIPLPITLPEGDYAPTVDLEDDIDITPYQGLLWYEIRLIEKKAKLTYWQAVCFEWYLRGLSLSDIAEQFGRKKSTIQTHIERAIEKLDKVKHVGLITVLVSQFGWLAVSEHLYNQKHKVN